MKKINVSLISAFVAGLAIGLIGGYFWVAKTSDSNPKVTVENKKISDESFNKNEDESDSVQEEVYTGLMSVVVEDQKAGNNVNLSEVKFKNGGYVAVREEKNGTVGNILGAKKMFSETEKDFTVELLRNTEVGNKYFIVFYEDNGDGKFDYKSDRMIEPIVGEFIAQ